MAEVSSIHIYPVKSLRGIELHESQTEARGLQFDRRWMIIDSDGRFVSQREDGRLATISTSIHHGKLTLSAGGMGNVSVDPGSRECEVQIWKDNVLAIEAKAEANEWISELLSGSFRLAYMPESTIRQTHQSFSNPEDKVSFADGFPLLFALQETLDELNSRLESSLPMNRFRPNVVVSGCEALSEDRWEKLKIGRAEFECVKPCGRCIVTTTDQSTGERMGQEPLTTLATYRKNEFGIIFGINAIPRKLETIRVGDRVILN